MAHVTHPNAPLTPTGRLALAHCVVEDGWAPRRAAERFQASHTTARRWADRYCEHGETSMHDASSHPHRHPRRTPTRRERRIIKLRCTRRWGPARIGGHLHMPASTVHRVLTRYGCARLAHLDRATATPVRRYERARPGELVHVDVKKLGTIPDGGGHRAVGRARGNRNRTTAPGAARTASRSPKLGHGFLHTALDDHSRPAYTKILISPSRSRRARCAASGSVKITV